MLDDNATSPSFKNYLTISEAAMFLGVSIETLRNWDRQNKFKPARHPLNGYRLYRREELEELLQQAANGLIAKKAAE
ncbi:MerR family transcriptional regulator [Nitrosococcus wardiae]|uniref:Helix-turn-helix domain-containing protein n=1 Tax=Nitrosococcus wardiae TaxID=1814290 RepID=A0A4P7C0Q2_9GAMM|nr:MerR family DNA-binding transcriptional regulator [Nitrosococcus wardiae]QBQ54306.1 helix-turn-helix domain-containing protein [Nitrosococcus wardiae]